MVESCSAYKWKERHIKGKKSCTFFNFPIKNKGLLSKWLCAVGHKNFKVTKHSRLCEQHFDTTAFKEVKHDHAENG